MKIIHIPILKYIIVSVLAFFLQLQLMHAQPTKKTPAKALQKKETKLKEQKPKSSKEKPGVKTNTEKVKSTTTVTNKPKAALKEATKKKQKEEKPKQEIITKTKIPTTPKTKLAKTKINAEEAIIAKKVVAQNVLNAKQIKDSIARAAWLAKKNEGLAAKDNAIKVKKEPAITEKIETPSVAKPKELTASQILQASKRAEKKVADSIARVKWLLKKNEAAKPIEKVKELTTSQIAQATKRAEKKLADSIARANWLLKKNAAKIAAEVSKGKPAVAENTVTIVKQAIVTEVKELTPAQIASAEKRALKKTTDSIARAKWLVKKNTIAQAKLEKQSVTTLTSSDLVTQVETAKVSASEPANDLIKNNISEADSTAMAFKKIQMNNLKLQNASEDIIALFAEEDYKQVVKLGSSYLKQIPTDTAIVIKTGLSNIFEKKFKDGFSLIDKTLLVKDTLVQVYATVPYIYKAAKGNEVQKEIVKHCKEINAENIWTHFAEASYFNNTNNKLQALSSGFKMHDLIANNTEADALGFLYPYLLQKYEMPDSAIGVLENSVAKYPNATGLQNYLFQHYKMKGRNTDAFNLINTMHLQQPTNEDYMESKIEMCMLLGKNTEACELLKTANTNNLLDEKVYKVGCASDFINVPLQSSSSFTYKINKNGNLYNMQISLESLADNNLMVQYKTETKKPFSGNLVMQTQQFDTSRVLNFEFFNKEKKDSSVESSCLWLSKICFQELKNNRQVYLNIGNGLGLFSVIEKEYFTENEDQNLFMDRIKVNKLTDKFVQTLHLYNTETAEQLWILDDEKNPMVVKMDGAFTMELSEVAIQ